MNDTLLDFPQKLTAWRMEHGMTILQFRQRCGMSKTSYYSLMNRTHFPNARTIANICRCTGMSADYLLGLADKDGRPEPWVELKPSGEITPAQAAFMADMNRIKADITMQTLKRCCKDCKYKGTWKDIHGHDHPACWNEVGGMGSGVEIKQHDFCSYFESDE